MKTKLTAIGAALIGAAALGAATAEASPRPDYCPQEHDHRSHSADYYDHYAPDRFYRGGSFSVTIGTPSYSDRGRRDDGQYGRNAGYGYDNGYRARGRRVVSRTVLPTRGAARIIVSEEIISTRRRDILLCTVSPRGPEADLVSYRRLRAVARDHCSPRARVEILA